MALLLVCVLYGASGLLAFDRVSTTTLRTLPGPWGCLFYASLLVAAVIALTGICWRGGLVGPLIERSGLLMLAGLWYAYSLSVIATSGLRGLGFFLICVGFGTANVVRSVQITRQTKKIAAAAAMTHSTDQLEGGS